jgi:hypothetical protein
MSALVNVADPLASAFETAVPESTLRVTLPVGLPVPVFRVTVTVAEPLALYVIVGAVMLVVVGIAAAVTVCVSTSALFPVCEEPEPAPT